MTSPIGLDRSDPGAQTIHTTLRELISEIRTIEIGKRDLDADAVVAIVLPRLRSLLKRTLSALTKLEEASGNELMDLCWLVQDDLKRAFQRLGSLRDSTAAFALFAIAEEVASKLLEGLCVVESKLASDTGTSSITQCLDLRLHPLRVRRLMARFRQRMRQTDSIPSGGDLETALRRFGSNLAWLRGQDDFMQVRASDRLMARELQEKILGWFQSPIRDKSEGQHICDELEAFVSMLDMVNDRREILQHDMQVLEESVLLLSEATGESPLSHDISKRLISILGRDDRLDRMLSEGANSTLVLERLVAILEDIRGKSIVTVGSEIGPNGADD